MSDIKIIEYIDSLPSDVEVIDINWGFLDMFSDLSRFTWLYKLECDHNRLIQLDNLPSSLKILSCKDNQLTKLDNLPRSLQKLDCSKNQLTQLDKLPSSLLELNCLKNQLTQLDKLPYNLKILNCSYNKLTQLDNLPSLVELNCSFNQITQLNNLPLLVYRLSCRGNKMKNDELKYWKGRTRNKKLKLLKEKISARKIQKVWRKYWYDFYRYELIDGKYIGFCRFIERSYSMLS